MSLVNSKVPTILWCFLILSSLLISGAYAFNSRPETALDGQILVLKESHLSPDYITTEWSRSIVNRYTEPVHEIITNEAWGCKNNAEHAKAVDDECSPGKAKGPAVAPRSVLEGAKWNDNPYFQLVKTNLADCRDQYVWLPVQNPVCWGIVFKQGEKDARNGKQFNLKSGDVLLLRSHFGDLQFLHSMRSGKTETPKETQDKVLMWAEFMWNAAMGKYERGTTIAKANVPALTGYFNPSDTMQRIFFRGNPTYVNEFSMFAFGSLLHMVEDSFSTSHVMREKEGPDGTKCSNSEYYRPARIVAFQNYAEQNSKEHAKSDGYVAMRTSAIHASPSVVDVVQVLHQLFERKVEWATEVEPYMRCVYEIAP
jgi:hypothetical protein